MFTIYVIYQKMNSNCFNKKLNFYYILIINFTKDLIRDTKNFLISYKVGKVFSHDFIVKSMQDVLHH